MSRRKRILARSLAALTALLGVVAVAEVAARVSLGDEWSYGTIPRLQWLDVGMRERQRGWAIRPSLRAEIVGRHEPYWIDTDPSGYRQPLRPRTKARDVLRVLVLGDSVAFGWAVDREESFAGRLESQLAEALGREVEVWNLACPGYSLDQTLWTYERERAGLAPDVAVLVSVLNDVAGARQSRMRGLAKPYYERRDGAWVRVELPETEGIARPLPTLRRLSGRSAFAALVRRWREPLPEIPQPPPQTLQWRRAPSRAIAKVTAEVSAELARPEAPIHESFRRLARALEADGVPLVVAACPLSHDPYLIDPRFEPPPEGRVESVFSKELGELARTFGADFVSFDLPFAEAVEDGLQLNCGDGHPNGEGHRIMAEVLAPALVRLAQ